MQNSGHNSVEVFGPSIFRSHNSQAPSLPGVYLLWYTWRGRKSGASENSACLFRKVGGGEPVREGLKGLDQADRHEIGLDLLRAQWRWPVGMPLCRAMGKGLWEIRADLIRNRTARVLVCIYRNHFLALHGFIKKTRATPEADLELARRRQKELER